MRSALLFPLAICLLLAGCVKPRVEHLTLEPVVIHVGAEGTSAESPDPELDHLAELQEKGDCEKAIPGLERFVEDFPESARYQEAVYRLGVCEEVVEHPQRARGYYLYVAEHCRADARAQALLRAAFTLETMGKPREAAKEYAVVERVPRASAEAKAGARLREAVCLFHAGRTRAAHRALEDGVAQYATLESPPDTVRSAAAEARFVAAQEIAKKFDDVRLEYPQRRLNARMAEKARLLASARDAFTDVVAIKDPEWAAAAVYRVGEMCESFYAAVIALPPPPDLDPAMQAAYAAKVELRMKPLKQQAFDAYVRVSALGERVGFESEWVDKSRERIKVLEPELQNEVLSVEPK
ncbi:MAG TPA: tetratricopeptide repeat protein [bacterium]|nr:tetratricopeptide repeat protein [bacterium]